MADTSLLTRRLTAFSPDLLFSRSEGHPALFLVTHGLDWCYSLKLIMVWCKANREVTPWDNPSVCFEGNTNLIYPLLCMKRNPTCPILTLPISHRDVTSESAVGVGPGQHSSSSSSCCCCCAWTLSSGLHRIPQLHFPSLALGPFFPALCFKNITSHAGGFCCTTARILDRSYICTLILLDASSLKLSQTHWPKSFRSNMWGGPTTQEFLTGAEGEGHEVLNKRNFMVAWLWTWRHLTTFGEKDSPWRAMRPLGRPWGNSKLVWAWAITIATVAIAQLLFIERINE